MKRGDERNPQVGNEVEDILAVNPPENSELMLNTNGIEIARIHEFGGASVGIPVFLIKLESHFRRIFIGSGAVGNSNNGAIHARFNRGDSVADIFCVSSDTALAGNVIGEKCDAPGHKFGGHEAIPFVKL